MALGLPLVQDPAALAIVRRFYLARNIPMPDANFKAGSDPRRRDGA